MKSIDLTGAWRLVRVATGDAVPAQVPGDTHSALLAAGKIPDPYAGRNELDVQWVGREDWAYERDFPVDPAFLAEQEIFLSCDSLDTIADIFLNGKKIGRADNMFVRWRFNARPFLKKGKNSIRIFLRSAERTAAAEAKKLPYPIPHTMNPVQSMHRNLVRKVQCHSGWDWGPCLMVAGIYGDIRLDAFSDVRIDYVFTEQKHTRGRCVVRVFVECEAARAGVYQLEARLGERMVARAVKLARGPNRPSIDVTMEDPRLWWPNGYGNQPLYDLTVRLGSHAVSKRLGLRKLELVNRKDKRGRSLTFRVNGTDIFCKGANWVPCDALPQRQDRGRLDHLLSSAARAHMNMLRVWGGGQYESEDFYDLCDQKGIMVWQDMMFSCALYPATPGFLASVDREVRHQVKRLRDHPSIALWCGNNEDVGALTWFPESRKNRDRYLVDYDRLNEGVVGKAVDQCDPTRTFWPSSPSAGRGDYSDNWHDDSRGDMHYWSVWHEGKPFSAYYEVAPRFCSEFGFCSLPSMETIRSFAGPEDLNATSPVMEHHQRHPRGNSNIIEMLSRYFRVPEGFGNLIYLSQVLQAMAIATAVEYWRRLRPVCMGTLFWQLDDTWPVNSWSSLEYNGAWKLLHYAAKRFFAPVMICAQLKEGQVEIWLVNDRGQEARGRATISVMDFQGKVLKREELAARAPAGSARLLKSYRLHELTSSPDTCFLHLTMKQAAETLGNTLFFTEPKRCCIERAKIRMSVVETKQGVAVRLSTDRPAFYVSLSAPGIPGEFEDNCFTLVPGAQRVVRFLPRKRVPVKRLRRGLSVRHLRDSYL